MIPAAQIQNREVAEYATEAAQFLASHDWCRSVVSTHLAWAVAGVLGVFLCRLVPDRVEVDDTLWVVVGDLPPAYLVCDDTSDWREALDAYIYEMEQWVAAVRSGSSLDDVIPVKVGSTAEHADMLDTRLAFIRNRILADDAGDIESDT